MNIIRIVVVNEDLALSANGTSLGRHTGCIAFFLPTYYPYIDGYFNWLISNGWALVSSHAINFRESVYVFQNYSSNAPYLVEWRGGEWYGEDESSYSGEDYNYDDDADANYEEDSGEEVDVFNDKYTNEKVDTFNYEDDGQEDNADTYYEDDYDEDEYYDKLAEQHGSGY